MANPFMPSAFASLNQAGQGTLEQLMRQRLFEQQLAESNLKMQAGVNADIQAGRRMDAQERYQQGMVGARLREIDARTAQDNLERQAELAEGQGRQAVLGQIADLIGEGNYSAADQLRVRHGLPSTLVARPKVEPTRAERDANLTQDIMTRRKAQADADKLYPRPTRVARGPKDDARLPEGVKAAIRSKKNQPGWTSGLEAIRTLEADGGKWWNSLLSAHPGLDRDAVRAFISNLYNERITPTMVSGGAGKTLLTEEERQAFVNRAKEAVSSMQTY